MLMSAPPLTPMRRPALHAAHHSLQVVCTLSPSHRLLLSSTILVPANLLTIPKQYHMFISPPLRRVYLADAEDNSQAVIDGLKSDIANLKREIEASNLRKNFLFEGMMEALFSLENAKEEARVALDKAKEETRLANLRLMVLKADYEALKLQ
jgi:hypothetical protein